MLNILIYCYCSSFILFICLCFSFPQFVMATAPPRWSVIVHTHINYAQLESGLPLPRDIAQRQKPKTESTSKLYPLKITDSKTAQLTTNYSWKFIILEKGGTPQCTMNGIQLLMWLKYTFIFYTEELKETLLSELKLVIKECPHAQRKVDSLEKLELMDITKELVSDLFGAPGTQKTHTVRLSEWD